VLGVRIGSGLDSLNPAQRAARGGVRLHVM